MQHKQKAKLWKNFEKHVMTSSKKWDCAGVCVGIQECEHSGPGLIGSLCLVKWEDKASTGLLVSKTLRENLLITFGGARWVGGLFGTALFLSAHLPHCNLPFDEFKDTLEEVRVFVEAMRGGCVGSLPPCLKERVLECRKEASSRRLAKEIVIGGDFNAFVEGNLQAVSGPRTLRRFWKVMAPAGAAGD